MKYYNIASAILAAIGLVVVYVGWNMANGHFWGNTYIKGDYTTLRIGLIWLVGAFALFAFSRIRNANYTRRSKNDHSRGSVIYGFLRFIAVVSLIIAVFYIIAAFSKEEGSFLLIGLGCIVNFFILYSLSYITEAACKYLCKCEAEENEEDEEAEE